MTTLPTTRPVSPLPHVPASAAPAPTRRDYAERDFGVGYGRSSGYASPRRYAVAWTGAPRFRCR